jgi:hypothetical protein
LHLYRYRSVTKTLSKLTSGGNIRVVLQRCGFHQISAGLEWFPQGQTRTTRLPYNKGSVSVVVCRLGVTRPSRSGLATLIRTPLPRPRALRECNASLILRAFPGFAMSGPGLVRAPHLSTPSPRAGKCRTAAPSGVRATARWSHLEWSGPCLH